MPGIDFIRDLGIVVGVAAVAGWICRRVGLSVIVGYLLAGVVVGPFTPPTTLVTDVERIQTLAQLGLVFLMFAIGLQLSVRRLRALGLGLVVATAVGALGVFAGARTLGHELGLTAIQGLFLAGMLVSSSSAVVSKALAEAGRTHTPSGQFAGAITVLEDVAAVVVLALLNSYVQFGGAGSVRLGPTLGALGAFVVLLGVGGLLLVPRLLARFEHDGGDELRTLLVAGLLCLLAFGAARAGYSLALGSFLLGVIVADTPQRARIERAFGGLRDLFSAVFFVAIGMMIDPHLVVKIWWQVLLVAAFALLVRPAACAGGLLAAGQPPRVALEGGLSLAPVGEFAFILAQVGVAAGVLPAYFQPLAVGVAVVTALVAPWLSAHAEPLSTGLLRTQPRVLGRLLEEYRSWLERVESRRGGSVLWQLSRRRFLQIAIWLLLATGLLLFAPPLERALRETIGLDAILPRFSQAVFWGALALLILGPVVAAWRNLGALAMLWAEVTTHDLPNAEGLRPVVQLGLQLAGGAALFGWLAVVWPLHSQHLWTLHGLAVIAAGVLALLWRRLVFWHSALEVRLSESLARGAGANLAAALVDRAPEGWNLQIGELDLAEDAAAAGRTIGQLAIRQRFGCMVVGIERQGFCVTNPPVDTALFPLDRLLVLGTAEQIASLRSALATAASAGRGPTLADLVLGRLVVPAGSPQAGRSLAETAPARALGVQIAGIRRVDATMLNPAGGEILQAGDELLVLGTSAQLRACRQWLATGEATGPGGAR